uniref:Uncharacterized protein n=1 Tax=Arundo donax TaxID=35708 RepID=A0A0A9B9V5_ARUDO
MTSSSPQEMLKPMLTRGVDPYAA